MHPRLVPALAASASLALLCGTTACAGRPSAAPVEAPPAAAGDAHGAVPGAEEVAEPQLGLTAVDASGAVRHLDLLDETVTELGTVGRPSAVSTDGRYVFGRTPAGVEVVDSGRWTWDHVDHVHHYRASPRLLGVVAGGGDAAVATTNLSTSGGRGSSSPAPARPCCSTPRRCRGVRSANASACGPRRTPGWSYPSARTRW
ncbi:hypothetical protein [Microlunatus sagamiharensis]|uniref:hypothetical protein n=1 Tax=Microlunatus sagamiharensis TaxID=546874 RepID=UPI0018D3FDAA|nr:hypothetical protein [Microlunatus sagamiharensis]